MPARRSSMARFGRRESQGTPFATARLFITYWPVSMQARAGPQGALCP
jgi:hypothetical protein